MMKTFALFLLLVGVLTAGAKTMVDDNLPGNIEDEDFDSLNSAIDERALAGDLDDADADLNDDDFDSLRSALAERALTGNLDDEDSDLDSLTSAMEERGLTDDLDDDNADMDSLRAAMEERGFARELENSTIEDRAVTADLDADDADLEKSTIEERALAGDATGAQPVDVARRGVSLRCRRWRCSACIRWNSSKFRFNGCVVARYSRRRIYVYLYLNGRKRWSRVVRVSVGFRIKWGRFYIYITNINLRTKTFCYQVKYKVWGWVYLKYPSRPKCLQIRW